MGHRKPNDVAVAELIEGHMLRFRLEIAEIMFHGHLEAMLRRGEHRLDWAVHWPDDDGGPPRENEFDWLGNNDVAIFHQTKGVYDEEARRLRFSDWFCNYQPIMHEFRIPPGVWYIEEEEEEEWYEINKPKRQPFLDEHYYLKLQSRELVLKQVHRNNNVKRNHYKKMDRKQTNNQARQLYGQQCMRRKK